MAIRITLESFLAVLQRSGLITKDSLEESLKRFKENGGDTKEARPFAEYLLAQKTLTRWQTEKLLQGKHKGFFLGRYRLLNLLGKGGMSSVYLAEHTLMRRNCAIKVLPAKWVKTDTSYLGRFHREAQAVAALDHPNIVRAYDVDHEVDNDMEIHFLVMEYVDGKNFVDLVAERGRLPVREAVEFICQAARGVGHAHRAGLVHRDIKPGNLLVDSNGTVKILDLGLAKFFQRDEASLTVQHDERVLGTADYLAPEQAVDSHSVDSRADIYSLGCTLYFLLTGHPPFNDGSLAQRLIAHQNKEPSAIKDERQDVPEELSATIRKMMAKDPNQRYQTADEAAHDLERWLDGAKDAPPAQPPATATKLQAAGTDVSQETPRIRSAKPGQSQATTSAAEMPRSSQPTVKPKGKTAAKAAETTQEVHSTDVGVAARAAHDGLGDFLAQLDASSIKTETRHSTTVPGQAVAPTHSEPAENHATQVRDNSRTKLLKETRREIPVAPKSSGSSGAHAAVDTLEVEKKNEATQSTHSNRVQKHKPWLLPIVVMSALAGIVLIAVFSGIFGGGDEEPAGNPGTGTAHSGDNDNGGDEDPETNAPRPILGEDIHVGPDGHFTTISAALEYLKTHLRDGGTVTQNIVVAPGTYADRIVINNSSRRFPRGVRIVCNDAVPAVLNPDGTEPVISLDDIDGFVLENFVIEAEGRPTAIHVGGYLLGTQLRRLRIQGVSTLGVDAVGVSGLEGQRFLMEDVRVIAAGTEAIGLKCTSGQQSTMSIDVVNCRFLGPMKAGIEYGSKTWNVSLRQCIFDQARTAVLITAAQPDLQGLAFINNTFHAFQRGIVFQDNPQEGSKGFVFTRNLFVDGSQREIDFEDGYDATIASKLISTQRYNWSERATPSDSANELDIFAVDSRRGIEIPLMSTNPDDPSFLKPGPEVREAVTEPADGYDYIGAVAP